MEADWEVQVCFSVDNPMFDDDDGHIDGKISGPAVAAILGDIADEAKAAVLLDPTWRLPLVDCQGNKIGEAKLVSNVD